MNLTPEVKRNAKHLLEIVAGIGTIALITRLAFTPVGIALLGVMTVGNILYDLHERRKKDETFAQQKEARNG